jgi:multidrug efflux pump subunit AcrB
MNSALQRHASALWLAAVLLVLGGLFAASRMPVSLFPHIDFPRVVVSIDAGDRDAQQMTAEVTRPLEIALRAIPGVTRVRSTTSRGSADIALDFSWHEDMVAATLATQSAIAITIPDLPPGVRFEVRRSDPTIFPALGIALTSRSLDPNALRQIAELQVRPALTGVSGVAGVDVLGGAPREIAVIVNPAKAQALGLSLDAVAAGLGKNNGVRGVGRLEDQHRLYLLLSESRLTSIADIAAIPVKAGGGAGASVVTLGQVAEIQPSQEPTYTRVTSGGRDAVLVNIRQSPVGDTVRIVQDVDRRLKELGLPPSVTVTPFYDQSELVTGAANAVRDAILIGAVLAGLVLFLFLRSGRLMVMTGLMLPAVLASSCLVISALGMSFNMMTLGGMAAAVGLIVDDAVVMLEHIMRRLQEGATSISDAAQQMSRPLFGSTAATIIIFAPLAFISGVTGGFFKALAVTMVAALGLSLVFARFLLPLIAEHWLRGRDVEAANRAGAVSARLEDWHSRAATQAFARPKLFAGVLIGGLGLLGFAAWNHVPSGFMPAMDEGGFILDYKAKPGAALTDTDRLLRQVEQIISATPEVASYSRRTGAQLGGGLTEADEGDYFIRLKGGSRRDIEEVMSEIRQNIQHKVPGLEIETAQLMEDLIGDLTAVPQPIEVKLFGDDPRLLAESARRVGQAIGNIPGVVEVVDGLRVAGDAIAIQVNPGAAIQHGLDPDAVATQVEAMVAGTPATQMRIGEQLVAVRVRAPADLRARGAALAQLPLVAPDGHQVPLGEVARLSVSPGQTQITREDLAPFIGVTARLEGRDLGSAMRDVRAAVARLKLPPSVRVDYGGLYAQQQQSFADLSIVFLAALLLTALLLTVLFGRLAWTLAAAVTVLLSAAAVLCGLWLTDIELDISALMGLTMVVGMVTELVIFFLAELSRDDRADFAALRQAGTKRLRPIVMSAVIAILTLAPLAVGISRGAGLQRPLATAIIFGLVAAVPLVLLLLPTLIGLLDQAGQAIRDRLAERRTPDEGIEGWIPN